MIFVSIIGPFDDHSNRETGTVMYYSLHEIVSNMDTNDDDNCDEDDDNCDDDDDN